jgi:carbonic anhydrase/acetyltransferase-like protein (isoleucine patch superfamily)
MLKLVKIVLLEQKLLITENKEIPDNSLVVGSPGKIIREVTEEEKKSVLENTKHYQDNWKRYSKSVF